jgi:hypothetical protein
MATAIRVSQRHPSSAGEVRMKASLTVRYVSGREERFEVELWGGTGAQARLDEFLNAPNLALQTADELVIIPGSAVECLSITWRRGDQGPQLQGVRPAKRLK